MLRTATPADAPTIAELHVATWRETYNHLLPEDYFTEGHLQGRHKMWNHILGNPRDEWRVAVAERDGGIIGFAFAGPAFDPESLDMPRELQVYNLYVSAAQHGMGAGQALLDAVIGPRLAMLWVAKGNPRAVAFYRRNGFEFDGTERRDAAAPMITDASMVR